MYIKNITINVHITSWVLILSCYGHDAILPQGWLYILFCFVFLWRNSPTRTYALSISMFLYHTQLDTQTHRVGSLWTSDQPLAEAAANTTNNTRGDTSMPSAGFEPTIPAIERPQMWALDRTATTHIAVDKLRLSDYLFVLSDYKDRI